MKLELIIFFCFLMNCLTFNAFSQYESMNSIVISDLTSHLSYISSDELKGRKLGSPELEIAKEYLIKNLIKFKVEPVSFNNNYLQNIGFLRVEPDRKNTFIKINDGKKEDKLIQDTLLALFPRPANFNYKGSVIFVGYGITDSIHGYDDYANVNVNGMVVMMLSGSLDLIETSNIQEPFNYELEYDKIRNAYDHGAKAVLWVQDARNKYQKISDLKELNEYADQQIYTKANVKPILPLDFIIISPKTADSLFQSKENCLINLQRKIIANKKPSSFEIDNLNITIQINRKVEYFESSNVIGFIEGSDSILKEECIIYTAHYDHLGVDENGNIYNGADDNGSGTVALLELAEAYMTLPVKPKRSILFAWMTAEEKGGAGSNYYVEHPLFPLEKTVACINLDMIGRVNLEQSMKKRWVDVKSADSLFVITSKINSELVDINNSACNILNLFPDYNDKQQRIEFSDQYFFFKKGVQVLFYHTGFHKDTHTIDDKIDKINFEKLKRMTQLAFITGFNIANNPNHPNQNNMTEKLAY